MLQFLMLKRSFSFAWQCEGGYFLFQHLLAELQTEPHKLLHVERVVSELGVRCPVLRVLPLETDIASE